MNMWRCMFMLGVLGCVVAYACDEHAYLQELVTNPQQASIRQSTIRNSLYANSNTYEEAADLLRNCMRMNPLLCFYECTSEQCRLSRIHTPHARHAFKNWVVRALVHAIDTHNEPIHYVSFASQGLFQDVIIISCVLDLRPNAHIAIHCVDFINMEYDTVTNLGGSCNVLHIPVYECEEHILTCPAYRRFMDIMNRAFPYAHIHMYAHGTHQHYLSYITQHNMPYPHVIAGCDFEEDPERNDAKAGMQLAAYCVQRRFDAHGIMLMKRPGITLFHVMHDIYYNYIPADVAVHGFYTIMGNYMWGLYQDAPYHAVSQAAHENANWAPHVYVYTHSLE